MRDPISSLPQYVFMGWCLVKQGDKFVFISSGTHPASYPMGTDGSFPEVKVAGA